MQGAHVVTIAGILHVVPFSDLNFYGKSFIVMPAEVSAQKEETRPRALGRLKSFMVVES